MEKIICLVCKGKHFRKGYYEVDVDVDIYSTAYNKEDIYIEIMNETNETADFSFHLNKGKGDKWDRSTDLFTYACENCGFIMNFTKEKVVESEEEEQNRKNRVNMYDWTDFDKKE